METKFGSKSTLMIVFMVAVIVTAGIVAFVPQSVMAASLDISDSSVTTNDGTLDKLTVDVSGDVTWNGAQYPPGSTEVKLQVQNSSDGSWTTIATETQDLSGLEGSYTYSFNGVDVTDSSVALSDFAADSGGSDGSKISTDVTFRVVADPSGNLDGSNSRLDDVVMTSDATATLTLSDEPQSAGVGGGGSMNAS
jgi:archaellum component FlaG (FlaF/FlaG flagellin family)